MRGELRDDLFDKRGNLGDDLCMGVDTYFKGVDSNRENFQEIDFNKEDFKLEILNHFSWNDKAA